MNDADQVSQKEELSSLDYRHKDFFGEEVPVAQDSDGNDITFTIGNESRLKMDDGTVWMSGEVETISGHKFYGILHLNEQGGGELLQTAILAPCLDEKFRIVVDHGVLLDNGSFDNWKNEMLAIDNTFEWKPFAYKYYGDLDYEDKYLQGDNGWSDNISSLKDDQSLTHKSIGFKR